MPNWDLIFYEAPGGRVPVQEYIDSLQTIDRTRVVRDLQILEALGIELSMPRVRRIAGSPLWELRVRGRTQHRVFYVTVTGRRILLLHAFEKKTQGTPKREIQTAERRLADYHERLD